MPNYNRLPILIFLVLFSAVSYSQSYAEIKNQPVEIVSFEDESADVVYSNLYTFVGEDFDSLDIEILSQGPIIGVLILGVLAEKDSITYGDIYQKWLEIKQIPIYPDLRVKQLILHKLEKLPANINNWEEDKALFVELGMEGELLEQFRMYVEENVTSDMTYETVLMGFREKQEQKRREEAAASRTELQKALGVSEAIDEIELMHQSVDESKPILLYFTGWNCVNCRKIEQNVFKDHDVSESVMENFIFTPVYVDDRTELPEEEQEEVMLGERIMSLKTVGDKNFFYQMSRFDFASQPYFVILSGNNQEMATGDYFNARTVDDFLSFLNEVLAKSE